MMFCDFFDSIGENMNIKMGKSETAASYAQRVILSAGAAWMLMAVYDNCAKSSVEHIKHACSTRICYMLDMLEQGHVENSEKITQYIYEVLMVNGAFLHAPRTIHPAVHRLIHCGGVALVRGLLPEEMVQYSGIAPYVRDTQDAEDVGAAFDLPASTPDQILQQVWQRSARVESIRIDEFLNVNRGENEPYFTGKRRDLTSMSMGRVNTGNYQYVYYLMCENEIRRIPDHLIYIQNGYGHTDQRSRMQPRFDQYCRLAIMNSHRQQAVRALIGRELAKLEFQYLLPMPELRFVQYIAWPNSIEDPEYNPWKYYVKSELWPMLKSRMELLGYRTEEYYG